MLPVSDLDSILLRTESLWEPLREKRIFLTGGTGFIGKWLIESFIHINGRLQLGASIHVLSRHPKNFLADHPFLANRPDLRFIEGDVRSFEFPQGEFSHVIHAATSVADPVEPIETFNTVVYGTQRVLELAHQRNSSHFLLISSGAVYGRQPSTLELVPESFTGAPLTTLERSAYGESKRAAEWLAFELGRHNQINTCVARCFAFVGPYLPLNKHFAIGNFIRDAMAGGPILVGGDGTTIRSYLYALDLTIWLWTILTKGRNGEAYNVGSDKAISIRQLADLISFLSPSRPDVLLSQAAIPGVLPERYVPDITKARKDLGLDVWTSIDEGIRKTMDWSGKFK